MCEIFCGKSLKKELSIDTTFDPCYFSWDSPFNGVSIQNTIRFDEWLQWKKLTFMMSLFVNKCDFRLTLIFVPQNQTQRIETEDVVLLWSLLSLNQLPTASWSFLSVLCQMVSSLLFYLHGSLCAHIVDLPIVIPFPPFSPPQANPFPHFWPISNN